MTFGEQVGNFAVCQRPKRAYLISTQLTLCFQQALKRCQRPKRAYLISTCSGVLCRLIFQERCQRPKRAYLISTT